MRLGRPWGIRGLGVGVGPGVGRFYLTFSTLWCGLCHTDWPAAHGVPTAVHVWDETDAPAALLSQGCHFADRCPTSQTIPDLARAAARARSVSVVEVE